MYGYLHGCSSTTRIAMREKLELLKPYLIKATIYSFFIFGWMGLAYLILSRGGDKLPLSLALIALTLSFFNFFFTACLWIFYLAKQFSTHSVKMVDIGEMIGTQVPTAKQKHVPSEKVVGSDKWAEKITGAMFGKEKLKDDSLT